ncbi:2-polyprenyl-3-methyl-5-hydroxy-6-metoxy-1,4-benzoquinol methylase [Rhodoligotrophos appendicifer]|uniref:class I SAM-dependent methyltransferase n=1 Tax=Rhodoligotrophos appendicifer TaxID=987056 RepID=UPI0011861CEE|nr:class I SAM-dependent methyltransferase [Rhodoligotrophos appendicifer]
MPALLWQRRIKGWQGASNDMVNIHIHHFTASGAVVDAEAMEVFQAQWTIYQKLVDSDVLSHRAVGRILHDHLVERFSAPFSFLDIACGDASLTKAALSGTRVSHYHGIDLAAPAIDLAAANLANEPYEVDLDHRDFVEAMADRPAHADAAWCGLSLHHLVTEQKLDLLREIRTAIGDGGLFMIYEPTLASGETREDYLARTYQIINRRWDGLSSSELQQIWQHIQSNDLPESPESWLRLGREAGFSNASELFTDPTDLYRMFRYEA